LVNFCVLGNETTVEIEDVDSTTSYTVLVAAENSAGVGALSEPAFFMPWAEQSKHLARQKNCLLTAIS